MNGDFHFDSAQVNEFQGFDQVEPAKNKGRGYSIAALVLGIVSVASCCLCCCLAYLSLLVMFVCGILAIVFACLSKKETEDKKMSGMAIAGLILGIAGLVIALVSLLLLVTSLATIGAMSDEELVLFLEENFKPYMTEQEYADFLELIQETFGRTVEPAQ